VLCALLVVNIWHTASWRAYLWQLRSRSKSLESQIKLFLVLSMDERNKPTNFWSFIHAKQVHGMCSVNLGFSSHCCVFCSAILFCQTTNCQRVVQSNNSMHHCECIVLCKDISLQRGRFCTRSVAAYIARSSEDRSSWMFFIQVVRGRPGGCLQLEVWRWLG